MGERLRSVTGGTGGALVEEVGTFTDPEFGRQGTYRIRLSPVAGGGAGVRSGVLTLLRPAGPGPGPSGPGAGVGGADPATFRQLSQAFYRDAKRVYWSSTRLKDADVDTFRTFGEDTPYAADKGHVVWEPPD